jgi:hypothetical protein
LSPPTYPIARSRELTPVNNLVRRRFSPTHVRDAALGCRGSIQTVSVDKRTMTLQSYEVLWLTE